MTEGELVRNLIRKASCSGCQFVDTHHGIGCFMFEDRAICCIKRLPGGKESLRVLDERRETP